MELTKIEALKVEGMNLPNYDFIHDVIGGISNDLSKKLEDYIIEGLKRKGFEFKTKLELEEFVKKSCRVEDNIYLKEKVYFVNDIPFFLHNYNIVMDLKPITTDRTTTMSANLGTYAYL